MAGDQRDRRPPALGRSFGYAFAGLRELVRSERNARLHALATVAVVAAGLALRLDAGEGCWIVLAVGAVWTAGGLNTSLEILADVVSPGEHPEIGRAKDVAAGAVLVAALGAAGIGLLVLGPKLLALTSGA